jgi:hypothetical protein
MASSKGVSRYAVRLGDSLCRPDRPLLKTATGSSGSMAVLRVTALVREKRSAGQQNPSREAKILSGKTMVALTCGDDRNRSSHRSAP